MTLSAIASLVCSKVRKTDDASVAACKLFLRQRHEMLYDAALWKDTVGLFTRLLEFDTDAVALVREVILPLDCARPLAVRYGTPAAGDTRTLEPSSLETWLRLAGTDNFEQMGEAAGFVEIEASGVDFTMTSPYGPLSFEVTDARDVGVVVQVDGRADDLAQFEEVTLTAGTANTTAEWSSVRALSKPVTYGSIRVTGSGTLFDDALYFEPHQTVSSFCRIRLDRVPTVTLATALEDLPTLLVLGKRRLSSFVRDSDAPMIRGSDNALIAFAQADMLERERQYAKAQAKVQEGQAMLALMIDTENNQSAGVVRLLPMVEATAGGVDDFGW